MTKPIRILPGEVIHEERPETRYSNKISQDLVVTSVGYIDKHDTELRLIIANNDNIFGPILQCIKYSQLKSDKIYYTRKGFGLKNLNVFSSEDYFCHDHRCFPSDLGGCTFCQYSERSKQRKVLLYPGDEVYVPKYKKNAKIMKAVLGYQFTKEQQDQIGSTTVFFRDNGILLLDNERGYSVVIKRINEYGYDRLGIYYILDTIGGTFAYTDLRISKRRSYLIDIKQLDYVCSEICIYGKDSEKCKNCETNKYKESIKNDIQGDYRKI